MFKVIEKDHPLHVHAICSSLASAQQWIAELAPQYCAKGYFMNKSLTPESFVVIKQERWK